MQRCSEKTILQITRPLYIYQTPVIPLWFIEQPKCPLISKGLFGTLNSSKKQTKEFDLTAMIPQVELFLFVFLEELKTPKRHFEIADLQQFASMPRTSFRPIWIIRRGNVSGFSCHSHSAFYNVYPVALDRTKRQTLLGYLRL